MVDQATVPSGSSSTPWLRAAERTGPGLVEALALWVLVGLHLVAVFATYTRLPPERLYNVSGTGLAGGASRVLVEMNFPTALIALAILGVVTARWLAPLPARSPERRRVAVPLIVAGVLNATIFWPGIVKQSNLDARQINALPALGVLLSLELTLAAVWATGRGRLGSLTRGDRVRLAIMVVMLFCALPWIGSDIGIPLRRWPLVGSLFLSDQLRTLPGNPLPFPAVHLGVHHGLDGTLMVFTALGLSRQLGRIAWRRLRTVLSLYLSLMFVYGLWNAAEDWEGEQIVKRGWSTHGLPSVLQPGLTLAWGGLLVATAIVYMAVFRVRLGDTVAAIKDPSAGT